MEKDKGYTIEIESSYPEFWRYNIALMCGCFDREDRKTGFVSSEDTVADVGSNLTAPPEGYSALRPIRLATPPCDHIVLYVYIIPHTLPVGRDIAGTDPFPLTLRIVTPDGRTIATSYAINQWSGASIELRVPETD